MKEQFVTYEIALKLKELGFDEECLAYYTKDKEFILLSAKKRGELVGHGSVRNALFKYLKENDRTYGELFTLSNSIAAPLWQQVEQWFRDKYNIHITILKGNYSNNEINNQLCYYYSIPGKLGICYNRYNTYEEAREQAILKAIEIINGRNI